MIHDAGTICAGNAADLRQTADMLDKASNNIASIYTDRAGGTVADWRSLMRAETWYDADEAVAAGLADRVGGDAPDVPLSARGGAAVSVRNSASDAFAVRPTYAFINSLAKAQRLSRQHAIVFGDSAAGPDTPAYRASLAAVQRALPAGVTVPAVYAALRGKSTAAALAAEIKADIRQGLIDVSRAYTLAYWRACRDEADQSRRAWLNSMVKFCASLWLYALES